jgi:hypothetical protein
MCWIHPLQHPQLAERYEVIGTGEVAAATGRGEPTPVVTAVSALIPASKPKRGEDRNK